MGKTYRRNQPYKPKERGKTFTKDKHAWKKNRSVGENEEPRPKHFDQDYDLPVE